MLSENGAPPYNERMASLEEEMRSMKKQLESLTGQLFGGVITTCLPLPRSRRLELAFKQVERFPNGVLSMIIKRYMYASKMSDLSFGDMMSPLVNAFGFERTWKIVGIDYIRAVYGDYAVLRWEEMAKNHPCEG